MLPTTFILPSWTPVLDHNAYANEHRTRFPSSCAVKALTPVCIPALDTRILCRTTPYNDVAVPNASQHARFAHAAYPTTYNVCTLPTYLNTDSPSLPSCWFAHVCWTPAHTCSARLCMTFAARWFRPAVMTPGRYTASLPYLRHTYASTRVQRSELRVQYPPARSDITQLLWDAVVRSSTAGPFYHSPWPNSRVPLPFVLFPFLPRNCSLTNSANVFCAATRSCHHPTPSPTFSPMACPAQFPFT